MQDIEGQLKLIK